MTALALRSLSERFLAVLPVESAQPSTATFQPFRFSLTLVAASSISAWASAKCVGVALDDDAFDFHLLSVGDGASLSSIACTLWLTRCVAVLAEYRTRQAKD